MSKKEVEKKVDGLLEGDTSEMTLSDMIDKVGGDVLSYPDQVYRLRRRHEEDTDEPMEEDDFGRSESRIGEQMFPGISERLSEEG